MKYQNIDTSSIPKNILDQIKGFDAATKAAIIHAYIQGYYNGLQCFIETSCDNIIRN